MIRIALIVASLLSLMQQGLADSPRFDPDACTFRAEIHADNSLQLYDEFARQRPSVHSEPVPEPVARVLKAAAHKDIADVKSEDMEGTTCKNFFHHVDRLTAPNGRRLYVSQSEAPLKSDHFDIVLYDPQTNRASPVSARLNSKWTSYVQNGSGYHADLRDDQPVSWIDLYGDQNPVLVFQNLAHDGTDYDAAIYHYYHVGPDLDLRPILARETNCLVNFPDWRRYQRHLSPMGNGIWKLTTTREEPDKKPAEIGYALIQSTAPGAPFRIFELHPRRNDDEKFLISVWDNPADMLIHGYSVEY